VNEIFEAHKELRELQQRRLGLKWFEFRHTEPTMRAAFALVKARKAKNGR
jgi:hypothetical protein